MKRQNPYIRELKEGLISGLPIVVGYFPVAMAFGIISKSIGISAKDSFLFSLLVFAGASQFMALDLIKAGMLTGNIVFATFLLNLRHLMMSASLATRMKGIRKKWLLFIAFGITDETFAVASLKGGSLGMFYLLALHGISYFAWVSGTIAGYLIGSILPLAVQNSLGIGLYAMFAAILTPEIKKSFRVFLLAIISAIIYSTLSIINLIPSGWALILTIIFASLAGVIFIPEPYREEIK